jgi:diguanylate cyclase (GGDEF)-like protein
LYFTVGCSFRASAVLAALVFAATGTFADGRELASSAARARELAGRDVAAAREALATLRRKAVAADDLTSRLAIDEIDCRVLSDTDAIAARQVAQAGIAAASPQPVDDAQRSAWLRLRACAAGVALDLGETARGGSELEAVLRVTEDHPALAHPRALALLERGLHRSRRGELVNGQQDLLQACRALEALQLRADLELCQSHLANHYKRMGDTAEALRLLTQLLKSARERGATMDIGVYAHGVAQVHYERHQWPQAKAAFEEELGIARAARDRSGISYAEYGLGHTMLHLGQPLTALAHAQRALAMLQDGSDPLQQSRNLLLEAKVYAALGRPQDAIADLKRIEQSSLKSDDDMLHADLLAMTAEVEAKLGHWREAYQALSAWQALNEQTQAQRLSEQSARLREEFNREKDAAEVQALRKVNAQGQRLQQMQGVALASFVALLAAASAFGVHKIRQGRRLHELATIDELTGLPNRRATLGGLADQLQIAQRLARPLAVMMVDVDHFKRINDTHGHAVGDEVLQHLGRVLAACLRHHDRVGRLGGEEFLVVLPDANAEQAASIAERMRHAVAMGPCRTANGPLSITISVGVACDSGDDATTATALVARADEALYAAKSAGRNTVSVRAAVEVAEPA